MAGLDLETKETEQQVLKPSFVSIIKMGFRLFIHSIKVFLPILIKLIVFLVGILALGDFLLKSQLLTESLTRIIFWLGVGASVAGYTLYCLLMILFCPVIQRYMITGEKPKIKFIFPIIGRRELKYFLCMVYFILIIVVTTVITLIPLYLLFLTFDFFTVLSELYESVIYLAAALMVMIFIAVRGSLSTMYILDNAQISVHQAIKSSFKATKGSIILLFSVIVLLSILEALFSLLTAGTWVLSTLFIDSLSREFNIINESIINNMHSLRSYIIGIVIIIQYYLKTILTCAFCSSIYLHYRQKLIEAHQITPVSSS